MAKDLSILIPARNEMFLNNTIEDILKNIEMDTEILVALDGQWGVYPIPQHPKVTIVYLPESIGQRASTNLLCRLSKAKYVMKCDAHCSFDKGFDKKLIEDMQDDWTVVPLMKNLHAFDWVCKVCGERRYQGPSGVCKKCGGETEKDILWKAKKSPNSTAMRFNTDLKFKYWSGYKKKQKGDLVETMSLLGACWMLTRKKYWELNICDEKHGSWGQQGTEVACKTWLSGGKLICNKKTWFAHMFRTQGGDFGFPYKLSGKDVQKARNYSKELWLGNKWDKAKYDLNWLIEKFNPPEWDIQKKDLKKGIIFYTDNKLNLKIAHKVQKKLKSIGLPITSSSLKPMPHFGNNEHIKIKRGKEAYFKQILSALERCNAEIVFFCEHDVLYDKSHFDFTPYEKDKFYFNINIWKWNMEKEYGLKVDNCKQISGMCCYKEIALKFYREKVKQIDENKFDGHYEPQKNRESFSSEFPNIDIRHKNNLTKSRWKKEEFKNQKYTEGWTESKEIPGWNGKI